MNKGRVLDASVPLAIAGGEISAKTVAEAIERGCRIGCGDDAATLRSVTIKIRRGASTVGESIIRWNH